MNPSKTGRRSLKSGLFEPKFWPPSAERNRPAPAATSKMPGAGATIRLIICPAKTVSSIPPSTIAQLCPPSVERNTPTPLLNARPPSYGFPLPAYTIFGLAGSTATAPIESEGIESMVGIQFEPPSVVFQIPPSFVAMYRLVSALLNARPPSYGFPLPAYTSFGLAGSTATAPIESEGIESMVGIQFEPPSVVFQIPPSFVAMYRLVSAVPLGSMAISVTSPESGPSP